MKYLKQSIKILMVVLFATSCTDFLNTKPQTQFAGSDVWGDPALSQTYVLKLYDDLDWGVARNAGNVDESRSRSGAGYEVNNGLITSDNSGFGNWGGNYSDIRKCNIFFDHADEIQFDSDEQKNRMMGEVHFLRALYYFNLAEYIGGVPILDGKVYSLNEKFNVPRNSWKETIDYIVKDLDMAADLLPLVEDGSNEGRATKGAALAYKARVLLYAASDLHNPDKNGEVTGSYSNPEYLGYTSSNATARWQAASDAAKAVIDLGIYSLYKPNPASAQEAKDNIYQMFMAPRTSEDIFVRYRNANIGEGFDGWSIATNGWYGNAGVGATWELTAAYENLDGTQFDENDPDDMAHPYEDRDPRFDATIFHEGSEYRPRPADLQKYDPVGICQFGTWETWKDGKEVDVYGLDTRNSVANSWNGNRCASTMKKYLDKSVDAQNHAHDQDLTYRYMRYGEILLDYAEAQLELGNEAEAMKYINMIRQRAYMPDVTQTGAALMAEYRNERRVELAYENQRFFDVRRWMIPEQAYHDIHGVNIVYELQSDHTTAEDPTVTPIKIMDGSWDKKEYFFPISRDEMNRNKDLIQNPGYD